MWINNISHSCMRIHKIIHLTLKVNNGSSICKGRSASMSLKRLVLQINSALTQLLIGLMLGGLWGSGGWAGGRMCPPFLDSNMISSLRASISWAWSCTSCISLCLSLTSAFLAPVNSWPCTREHLLQYFCIVTFTLTVMIIVNTIIKYYCTISYFLIYSTVSVFKIL